MIKEYEKIELELKSLLEKRETAVDRLTENERNYQWALSKFKQIRADVERLEEQSISTFFQNIFGTYEDNLEMEKQEEISAKNELDTAAASLQDAKDLLAVIDEEINLREKKLALLREELKETDECFKEKITQKEEEQLAFKQEAKELDEALQAGETVLQEIDNVLKELDSASSLATWDLFSDSFFIDMMKYNKIDKAEKELNYLERALRNYKKELNDVDLQTSLYYEELSQMNRVFDIFFDNIFSDWNTRDTIRRNISMLEDMMYEVEDIQNLLTERKKIVNKKIQFSSDF